MISLLLATFAGIIFFSFLLFIKGSEKVTWGAVLFGAALDWLAVPLGKMMQEKPTTLVWAHALTVTVAYFVLVALFTSYIKSGDKSKGLRDVGKYVFLGLWSFSYVLGLVM